MRTSRQRSSLNIIVRRCGLLYASLILSPGRSYQLRFSPAQSAQFVNFVQYNSINLEGILYSPSPKIVYVSFRSTSVSLFRAPTFQLFNLASSIFQMLSPKTTLSVNIHFRYPSIHDISLHRIPAILFITLLRHCNM